MDRRELLPNVREEDVEDLKAKWDTWPEIKDSSQCRTFQPKENRPIYDEVTYPAHYAGNGKITCKDAFASMMYPLEGIITPKIGYWLGCTFKYIWRAFLKGDPETDLRKAKQCINEMLKLT